MFSWKSSECWHTFFKIPFETIYKLFVTLAKPVLTTTFEQHPTTSQNPALIKINTILKSTLWEATTSEEHPAFLGIQEKLFYLGLTVFLSQIIA